MKTKTISELSAVHKFKPSIKKACYLLLVPCILFSSCGKNMDNPNQNLTKNPTTTVPQETLSPAPTLTTIPKPTPTITPIRTTTPEPTPTTTPTPTLEPTLAPDFTFFPQPDEPDKTALSDYMSQEEIDAAFSLSYDPYSPMQLYARYQGVFQLQFTHHYYCIDLIQLDDAIGDILINIKIFSGWPRFLKYGESTLLQNIYYYVDSPIEPEVSKEVLQIMDLNNDRYDDFIFDLGISGKNLYSLAFIYDTENSRYTFLGDFYTATYIPEKQMIYEYINNSSLIPSHQNKYILSGAKAVLSESISSLNDASTYTYQRLVGDEFVTILKDVTYEEINKLIDFDTWWNTPLSLE